jgi:serine/threonine protein phosphatase PrpC
MRIELATRSDIGCVRTNNEDMAGAVPERLFVAVADGLGGHAAGEVASARLMEQLLQSVRAGDMPKSGEAAGARLTQAIEQASLTIFTTGQGDATLAGMATTCCCLWVCGDGACVAHVGDSRVYRLRNGVLEQLTNDHVVDVQQMHPFYALVSGGAGRVLTRAIGSRPEVEVEWHIYPVQDKDLFLLCSDGLSDMVSGEQIRGCLTSQESLEGQATQLVELAKRHGGIDNITLVLAQVWST